MEELRAQLAESQCAHGSAVASSASHGSESTQLWVEVNRLRQSLQNAERSEQAMSQKGVGNAVTWRKANEDLKYELTERTAKLTEFVAQREAMLAECGALRASLAASKQQQLPSSEHQQQVQGLQAQLSNVSSQAMGVGLIPQDLYVSIMMEFLGTRMTIPFRSLSFVTGRLELVNTLKPE